MTTGALEVSKEMIARVAVAIGPQVVSGVAFVGGCTTGLWVTDDFSRQAVRFTDDVDLIVNVMGKSGWYKFRDQLLEAGFSESAGDINCRLRLGELKVDFMPDDSEVLGFTNRWYKEALKHAVQYQLNDNILVRIVSPVYLVATKFEAFKGRGNNDPLTSPDLEDILTLIDGRPELGEEIQQHSEPLCRYIATEIQQLLALPDFEYVVQSTARGDFGRETVLLQRLQSLL